MPMQPTLRLLAASLILAACGAATAPAPAWNAPGNRNPVLPGYFADPSIVRDDGRWYVFATIDPWGGDRLGLWTSDNGRDWTFSTPAWPTKAAATSATSGDAKIWAPSVVKAANGRWYMYVSVGSEIWVGSAPSPAGPWADANGGRPLVARSFDARYHMIDAEAFVDDDGQAYLYWGSGLNWVNGHCFAVKLKPDMVNFDGEPRDVTPGHYFEAPFMVKSAGHYLLTYSDGNTTKDTYQVRYAVGDGPLGPFREAPGGPILQTDRARAVISPGHHAVFRSGGRAYVLYGRQALPWPRAGEDVLRQVAVDELDLRADGSIAPVVPSHDTAVAGFAPRRHRGIAWRAGGTTADPTYGPERAADDNYGTLWRPDPNRPATLVADLGGRVRVCSSTLRPAFADREQTYGIEASDDGRSWRTVKPVGTRKGSPIVDRLDVVTRWLRLTYPGGGAGLWEWTID